MAVYGVAQSQTRLKWLSSISSIYLFYNFIFNNNDLSMGGIYYKDFPCGSAGKESAHNAGDLDSIPGLERSPGGGKGYPLQYSGLENSMDCPWGPKELDMTERLSLSLQG